MVGTGVQENFNMSERSQQRESVSLRYEKEIHAGDRVRTFNHLGEIEDGWFIGTVYHEKSDKFHEVEIIKYDSNGKIIERKTVNRPEIELLN